MALKRGHSDYDDKKGEPPASGKSSQSLAQSPMPSQPSPTEDGRVRGRRKSKANVEGNESDYSSDHNFRSRKKAEPVKSACVQCQRRKTKCSGQRPTCLFCSERDLVCSWEISDGMTRTADLKQKLQDATARSDDLDALVDAMRTGTDEVSTMLLAKLRLGASVEALVRNMKREPALTEDSASPSELAYSSNLSEIGRPGTSTRSPDTQPSASSPDQPFPHSTAKLEPAHFKESRAPSVNFSNLATTRQSYFLGQDFDQSRMIWKGHHGNALGAGVIGAEERLHGRSDLYMPHDRRPSAPTRRLSTPQGQTSDGNAGAGQLQLGPPLSAAFQAGQVDRAAHSMQGSHYQAFSTRGSSYQGYQQGFEAFRPQDPS